MVKSEVEEEEEEEEEGGEEKEGEEESTAVMKIIITILFPVSLINLKYMRSAAKNKVHFHIE